MSTLREHWYRVRMIERTNEDAPGMASGEQKTYKVLAKNKKEAELRFTRAGDNVLSVEDVGSDLHVQAAKALGWTVTQAQSMSMLALREAVRLVDPALADDMSAEFRSGRLITGKKRSSGKRGTIKADMSWVGQPPTAAESASYEARRQEVLRRNAAEGSPSLPPGSRRG